MKKLFCVAVSMLLVFAVNCVSPCSAATEDEATVDTFYVDTGEYGYDFRLVDSDGNELDTSSTAASSGVRRAKAATVLPSSYDARDSGVITSVKSQGSTGCCWAFATMASLEADAVSKGFKTTSNADFSEAHLAWFTYADPTVTTDPTYGDNHNVTSNAYLYGGNWLLAAATLAKWSGIANESDYAFTGTASTMGNYGEDARYNYGSGLIIDSTEEYTTAAEIKNRIMDHGVCTASIYYSSDYESNSSYYNPNFDTATGSTNHMISIIGWNDNYSAGNFNSAYQPASDGAWLIKDSWGAYSHTAGCYWVSYSEQSLGNFVGFNARSAADVYHNYTYNGINWNSYISTSNQTEVANVFTPTDCQTLTAVSFYTIENNVNVTVEIYNSVSSGPESGTLVTTETVSEAYSGYHTYDLSTPVSLFPGEKFSVVLTYTVAEGSYAHVPCENNNGSSDFYKYTVAAGQSYMNVNGWTDVIDYNSANSTTMCNFCIQAIAECRHQYSTVTTAPTCVDDGYVQYTCTQCGKTYIGETLPATGNHTWGAWSAYTKKANSNTLESTRVCSVCGAVETQQQIIGSKTITLRDLLEIIFTRIFSSFRFI